MNQVTTACLGAGCFWTVEATLRRLAGIEQTECGYIWMTQGLPTHESAVRAPAERMEVVRFTWDTLQLTPQDLLEFVLHTSQPGMIDWNYPGELANVRHGLFLEEPHRTDMFGRVAEHPQRGHFQVLGFPTHFMPAGRFDQNYYDKRPTDGYCRSIIVPKLDKMERMFAHLLKK